MARESIEKEKPGIMLLCPFFPPNVGGVETHLGALASFLGNLGFPTSVVSYKPITTKVKSYARREKIGPVTIRRFWWFGHNWFEKTAPYPLLQFVYVVPGLLAYTLYFLARHGRRVEVIHAHGFAAAFAARVSIQFFKRPLLVTTHFIYGFDKRRLAAKIMKWTLASCTRVLVVSEEARRDLISAGIKPGRITLYRHWIDQDLFAPGDKVEAKRALGLNARRVVLFVGRLIEMKGVRVLLETARNFDEHTCFVFVGEGPLAQELETAAKSRSNVIFAGKKSQTELAAWYAAGDLAVIPSQAEECSPVTLAEALSCGTPVVAADKGGIREFLGPEVGVAIKPTVADLTDTISTLLADPARLAEMSGAARDFALKSFGRANARPLLDEYLASVSPLIKQREGLAAK